MLALKDIKNYYPQHLHGEGINLLREYLQYEILRALFYSKYGNLYTFLDGTCLRIVHKTERFSEDLDFDNVGLSEPEFQETGESIKRHLQQLGYEVTLKFVNRGAFHCNVRFPALLYKYGLSGHKEAKLLIKLDTEKQHFDYERLIHRLDRFGVQATIRATPLPLLLSQKITDVMGRKRAKGRDFYDIHWALRRVKPNYDYLTARLEVSTPDALRQLIANRIESFDFDQLGQDVSPWLMNPEDERMVTTFPKFWQRVEL